MLYFPEREVFRFRAISGARFWVRDSYNDGNDHHLEVYRRELSDGGISPFRHVQALLIVCSTVADRGIHV